MRDGRGQRQSPLDAHSALDGIHTGDTVKLEYQELMKGRSMHLEYNTSICNSDPVQIVVLDDNAIAGAEYTCMWNISLQIFGEACY